MKEKLENYPTLFLTLQKFVKKTGCLPLWATKDFKERTVKQRTNKRKRVDESSTTEQKKKR